MTTPTGVSLGHMLLALDSTVATLVGAPNGLDQRLSSAALLDVDDIHLGLGRAARGAELFLFVGVPDDDVLTWLSGLGAHRPVAILCKAPSERVVERAETNGVAVIAIDPHARWERIYHLVMRVLEGAPGLGSGMAGESMRSGAIGDLFELASEVARRTGGLVSIEDERSHVLAYSSAGDEADELRRLSILGREGPPEMLAWLRQWGVMDAVRIATDVVVVDERADLALRPRRAIGIRRPAADGSGEFLGVLWLQQGRTALSTDTDEVLAGAAAVAARMISRRKAAGTAHDDVVRRLLGARGEVVDADYLGTQLGIAVDLPMTVVGFGAANDDGPAAALEASGEVSALTLHASAFSQLSVTSTIGPRAYVILPQVDPDATVAWGKSVIMAAERQFGVALRAVIAGPDEGLVTVPGLRAQVDRVLDAAEREGELIADVTTVAESQTGVLLGEIVAHLTANPELMDTRVVELAETDRRTGSEFVTSLRVYLDRFGDVRSAASTLHIHPNTLRYRIRRLQEITGMDLDDPATRLVVALSLRAGAASKAMM
ncbi:PucR family transcriptional regulator [Streptomyces sp. SID6673]|nr:PucR family transcriptional regulator [Streptomyces sp. SID11726]NEB22813.1 PucR family transcriptional regulator [Streptomyces sp. SID6673]